MYNRKVKFGLKSPNRLGKMSKKFRGVWLTLNTGIFWQETLIFVSLASRYESSSDGTNSPWYEQSKRVRTVQKGTNSPQYEQSKVRKVQGRYEQSMVRTVQDGTNSPRYEQSKIRKVQGRYEQSMVRTVQGTNSPSMVRIVQGTNSPRNEKSRYRR